MEQVITAVGDQATDRRDWFDRQNNRMQGNILNVGFV